MKTLQEIEGGCRMEEGDDGKIHWIWAGASFEGTARIHAPNFTADPSGNTSTTQSGRRAVWHVKTGEPIKPGRMVFSKCGVDGCIGPECIGCGTKVEWGKFVRRTGRWHGLITKVLASRRNSDLQRKVTRPVAEIIWRSDKTNLALAAELGLNRDTISRVRRGLNKVQGNMFAGLMP